MDWECRDVVIYDDDGVAVYQGPRFLRCNRSLECGAVMTHARLQALGRCVCGNRRFVPALKVMEAEREDILAGVIPTLEWEMKMIEGKLEEINTSG